MYYKCTCKYLNYYKNHIVICMANCTPSASILFSYLKSSAGRSASATSTAGGVPFSRSGLQLIAVDLLQAHREQDRYHHHDAAIRWVSFASLQDPPSSSAAAADYDPIINFVKLVSSSAPVPRQGSSSSGVTASTATSSAAVTLIVGTADGHTFLWDIDSNTGLPQQQQQHSSQSSSSTSCPADSTCSSDHYKALSPSLGQWVQWNTKIQTSNSGSSNSSPSLVSVAATLLPSSTNNGSSTSSTGYSLVG